MKVHSPRNKDLRKRIEFRRSPSGRAALFVAGDLRYISYDLETLENASLSNVVGHSVGSRAYWFNETLYFQNGRANWFLHAHRLYHSLQSGEIEQSQTNVPPPGAEQAFVFNTDSAAIFIMLNGQLEAAQRPVEVIRLRHNQMEWETIGQLSPSIMKLMSRNRAWQMKDYVIAMSAGSALIIRLSDLHFILTPSRIAETILSRSSQTDLSSSLWLATKGDSLLLSTAGQMLVESVSEMTRNMSWSPLIEPLTEGYHKEQEQAEHPFRSPRTIALIVLMLLLFALLFSKLKRPAGLTTALPPQSDAPSLSPHMQSLLSSRQREFSSEALDTLFGLDVVESPETRRSRRARIVQLVNAESQARFGEPLIERTRSETDKRVFIYRINKSLTTP